MKINSYVWVIGYTGSLGYIVSKFILICVVGRY